MKKVIDPLRHTEVPLTPEEAVRQWFITVLRDDCKVPVSLMNSEVSFSLGEKKYRADILIWNRNAEYLAVVECKRPRVPLSREVLDQAIRYNMALKIEWIFLTNGKDTVVLHRENGVFVPVNELPDYEKMLG